MQKPVLACIVIVCLVILLLPVLPVHAATPWNAAASIASPNIANLGYTQSWEPYGFYQQNQFWIFYANNEVNCGGSQLNCLDYQCSSNGVTFAKTNVGVQVETRMFSLYTNGTYIFYVRYAATFSVVNHPLIFRDGKLGASCSITWNSEQTVLAADAANSFDEPTVALDTSGQAYVSYTKDGATSTPHVINSAGTNYASWSGDTQLSATDKNAWFEQLVQLPSAKMYVAFWNNVGNDFSRGAVYNAGWGTTETISSDNIGDRPAFLMANGAVVSFIYEKTGSGGTHYFTTRNSVTGSWSIPSAIAQVPNNHPWLGTAFYESNETVYHWINYDFTGNTIREFTTAAGTTNWQTPVNIFSTVSSNSSMAVNGFWGTKGPTTDVIGLVWTQNVPAQMFFANATITTGSGSGGGPGGSGNPTPPSNPPSSPVGVATGGPATLISQIQNATTTQLAITFTPTIIISTTLSILILGLGILARPKRRTKHV